MASRQQQQRGGFTSLVLATLKFNKLCIDDVCVGIVEARSPLMY